MLGAEDKMRLEQVKKIQEIMKEIQEQCRMLGGVVEYSRALSETMELFVCAFPEPTPLTRVSFKEAGEEGELYIENIEGWNGAIVDTRGIPVSIEVKGVKGDAVFSNTGVRVSREGRARVYDFVVYPSGRSKTIKKARRIEYYVSLNGINVRIE